jgi:glucose 1-dehydrogenase
MRLENKVAIVTGGSLGIGAGIVRRLAAEGCAVTLGYLRSQETANMIAADVKNEGGKALVVQADVSQIVDLEKLLDQTVQTYGRLDILVNNAGIEIPKPFTDVTPDDFDRQIAVNLYGPFFGTQLAVKQLIAQGGGGVIINISSVHEDLPMPGNEVYCAAKGGLRMLTRTLANTLSEHKIRIINIGPGAIATLINQKTLSDPQKKQALLDEIPLGRIGQAEDIAAAVAWLASDDAGYVTGTTLFVDGGLMVHAGSL